MKNTTYATGTGLSAAMEDALMKMQGKRLVLPAVRTATMSALEKRGLITRTDGLWHVTAHGYNLAETAKAARGLVALPARVHERDPLITGDAHAEALLAIAAAMPLTGRQSLAMLPCRPNTAGALEDRKLIKAEIVLTADAPHGVRWSLTDLGWAKVTRIKEEAQGCFCGTVGTEGDMHNPGCPVGCAPESLPRLRETVPLTPGARRFYDMERGQQKSSPSVAAASVALGSLLGGVKPPAESRSTEKDADDKYWIPSLMDVYRAGRDYRARCASCPWVGTCCRFKADACTEARGHECEITSAQAAFDALDSIDESRICQNCGERGGISGDARFCPECQSYQDAHDRKAGGGPSVPPFLPIPTEVITMWDLLSDADKIRFRSQMVMVDDSGTPCSGCDLTLVTEEDFHKHFVYPEGATSHARCPVAAFGMPAKAYPAEAATVAVVHTAESGTDAIAWLRAEAAKIDAGRRSAKRKPSKVRRNRR